MAATVMVYVVKTLFKSMIEQVLSMKEMFNLMTVSHKQSEKEAKSKSVGTLMCTPIGISDIKFDWHAKNVMGTDNSKSDGTLKSTPN